MLYSLLILTSSGDILIERHYRENLRAVADLYISTKSTSNFITLVGEFTCVKVDVNDVSFVAILKDETSVPAVLELLQTLIDVINLSLGSCDVDLLKENFSGILLVMEEMIDYGSAFNTELHTLMYLLKPDSFLQKITRAFREKDWSYLENAVSNDALTEYPWRPRDVKYRLNEALVDVIEYANMIMDKNWNVISHDLVGHIQVEPKLTGMPELTMFIHAPHPFLHTSFHPCAFPKRKRFEEEKVVVFTPLDHKFVVFKYCLNSPVPSLPFKVSPGVTFEDDFMKFEIRAESRMILTERPQVSEFRITFNLPK